MSEEEITDINEEEIDLALSHDPSCRCPLCEKLIALEIEEAEVGAAV